MRAYKTLLLLLPSLSAAALAFAGQAQALPSIKVGKIASQQECTWYENTASAAVASSSQYSTTIAAAWRTWWVKDCTTHFAAMKTSVEAALAASGKLAVSDKGANYVLNGIVSAGGTSDSSVSQQTSSGSDFSVSGNKLFATMDVTLQDSSGKKTFGVLVRKEIDLQSDIATDGISTDSQQSGQTVYNQLQDKLALAVGRKIAFHIAPLTVTGNEGRQIQLNYGAPYLQLGTTLQATSPDGVTTVRYNVVSAGEGYATAEKDGDGQGERILPGSTAVVIESDDPAANGRRLKRVDLP